MHTHAEAKQHLHRFFAHALGYQFAALQSESVCLLPFSAGTTPFSLFRKSVLILHAPLLPADRRLCVLAAHPLLMDTLAQLVADLLMERLFEETTAQHFSALVQAAFPGATILPDGEHLIIRYVTDDTFRPHLSEEYPCVRLLPVSQVEYLPLLSRYPGGVYAICDAQGKILSRAGIREESAVVWEIGVRTEREDLRGKGLAKTVVSAATSAVLRAGRVPLYIHSATNLASQKVALALGYQHYADARVWMLLE